MKNRLGNSDVNYTFFDRIVKYKAWNPPLHPILGGWAILFK